MSSSSRNTLLPLNVLHLLRKIRKHGLRRSFSISKNLFLRYFLFKRLDHDFMHVCAIRREMLGRRIHEMADGRVLYGDFNGLQLVSYRWGARDIGSMIFGEYERHIVELINQLDKSYSTFIDVGAADGFFAVGFLYNNRMLNSICFESSSEGRDSIAINARANLVEEKVLILGTASQKFAMELSAESGIELDKCIFLFDIEGAEFELLSRENLSILRNSILVVELHKESGDYELKLNQLCEEASEFFTISNIHRKSTNTFEYKELESWPDEDRQIIFSEGRRYSMTWLAFTPKSQQIAIKQ